MRKCFGFLSLWLLLLSAGCGQDVQEELRSAQSLTILYTFDGELKHLKVEDPATLQGLLATLCVQDTDKGTHAGLVRFGGANFAMPDGSVIETAFTRPAQIDRFYWGQVYLRDTRFYEKLCELASQAEGRPIEILVENE